MIKEHNGSTWQGKAYSKIVDTTQQVTSFPVVVRPMENTIPSWTIKGNMSQSGTPTPTTPIQPSECGDKTANLCSNIPYKRNYYINENGVETSYNGFDIYKVSAIAGTTYTLSLNTSLSGSQVRIHSYSNGSWIEQTAIVNAQSLPATFTTPNNCDEIRFSINYVALGHIMLNTGSQPLPYEPYGYKIPISSANTTTPVYLGEVQSTRKIRKLVLTGGNTENWEMVPSSNAPFVLRLDDILETASANTLNWLSNQYVAVTSAATWSNYDYCITSLVHGQHLRFRDIRYNSLGNFLTYLQQQHAAGTPVCVWYVLAEPTTGIVNEPLRKIGDYADTVSGTNLSVTSQSPTTIDVDTSLKPSEVDLTYTGTKMCKRKKRINGVWV